MRATSLPSAHPITSATLALVAAAVVPAAIPSAALAQRWQRPVPGDVARSFSYVRAAPFAAGAHRGVDLAAPPGTAVRAACAGTVIHAGDVAGRGGVVSLRCGRLRVSHLPLARIAVRAGTTVPVGVRIGTVATGHRGLHLGVRREADRFGYIDPAALLPRAARPPVHVPASPRVRSPRGPAPGRVRTRSLAPRPAALVTGPHVVAPRAPAPWPVWAGLALLLAGAAGSGSIVIRRRRARTAAPVRTTTVGS